MPWAAFLCSFCEPDGHQAASLERTSAPALAGDHDDITGSERLLSDDTD
jgi:hypothetical protein